jgi:hypothetical protein
MNAANYEDNFGWYDIDQPDEKAFLEHMKASSRPTRCLRCRETVRLLPGRETCGRCCEAIEFGADQDDLPTPSKRNLKR